MLFLVSYGIYYESMVERKEDMEIVWKEAINNDQCLF